MITIFRKGLTNHHHPLLQGIGYTQGTFSFFDIRPLIDVLTIAKIPHIIPLSSHFHAIIQETIAVL